MRQTPSAVRTGLGLMLPAMSFVQDSCRGRCGSEKHSPRRVNVTGMNDASEKGGIVGFELGVTSPAIRSGTFGFDAKAHDDGVVDVDADGDCVRGCALREGTRRVMRVGTRLESSSVLVEGLVREREDLDDFDKDGEAVVSGDVRFRSAVSASGGLYIVLGRRCLLPGPVSFDEEVPAVFNMLVDAACVTIAESLTPAVLASVVWVIVPSATRVEDRSIFSAGL